MKKHELKAQYEAKAIELLSAAQAWSSRSSAADRVVAAERRLHKRTLAAMDAALSIYSEQFDQLRDDFSNDVYSQAEYLDEQSLNILQKCVEMCIPNTNRARPIAYVLSQAHAEGYIDGNVEEFVTEFFEGLEDAVSSAEQEIGGDPYFSYYSSEDEFPASIPEQSNPSPK